MGERMLWLVGCQCNNIYNAHIPHLRCICCKFWTSKTIATLRYSDRADFACGVGLDDSARWVGRQDPHGRSNFRNTSTNVFSRRRPWNTLPHTWHCTQRSFRRSVYLFVNAIAHILRYQIIFLGLMAQWQGAWLRFSSISRDSRFDPWLGHFFFALA